MSGGYISCGDFTGEDKSGSALLGVVEDLRATLRWENHQDLDDLLADIHAFFSGEGVPPEAWEDAIEVSPGQMAALQTYLEKVKTNLVEICGTDDFYQVMETEEADSGIDPGELKWGKGVGWRLYCVTDLLMAAEHAIRSKQPVIISFD